MNELLLVLDFGGQYKELIARAVRELNVYAEVRSGRISVEEVRALSPIGIILTGGPNSVYQDGAPMCDAGIFGLGIPVLGICYGMQMMCHMLGGIVKPCANSEYGRTRAALDNTQRLLRGTAAQSMVLMSHTDYVEVLPAGFVSIGQTADCPHAACADDARRLYGTQFHPETTHSDDGRCILCNFLYDICGAAGDYRLDDYLERQISAIREQVGQNRVLLALSGGVDSSVCAALLTKALPGRLVCIFVDHGFMRMHEGDDIERVFTAQKLTFIRVNAQKRFLDAVKGVTDPEKKRKIIGQEFARVFEEEAAKLGDIPFLAQGTIYPDVIESGGEIGAVIKSHHNVGGLPEGLKFTAVVEPLSGLFKDEVRRLGQKLRLPKALLYRQPFPGPGLSIRVMGSVTRKKLDLLRRADAIVCEELARCNHVPQQYFAVLTDTRSVGVKGDARAYEAVVAVRAVTTSDFMTCEYTALPHTVLNRLAMRITSEVPGVSRVVYDITSKPPGTIEWE